MSLAVTPVRYAPHDPTYRLAVEVVDAAGLRSRVAADPARGFERVDFHAVIFVRSGRYEHTIDFRAHRCEAGSCLVVAPGQVHRFGAPSEWDGWALVVSAHHVAEAFGQLPTHVRTGAAVADAIDELFRRMTADIALTADRAQLEELLVHQTRELAMRLVLGRRDSGEPTGADPSALERYREYQSAVDREFRRWHQVTPYARHLGCSPKSINRACRSVGGTTAKRVIVERIVLEAKRLLAHGTGTVAAISTELGFDEPTNFVKFFRRETELTPTQFRRSTDGDGAHHG